MASDRAVYTDDEVVAFYSRFEEQRPAELAWISENHELLGESAVLDFGVAAGRTTQFLTRTCKTYIGMDCKDRGLVLAQASRVLRCGGSFLLSSHNQDARRYRRLATLERPRLTRVWARRTARRLRALARHARLRRQEVLGDGSSIVNDVAHDYRLMPFDATQEHQQQALSDAGCDLVQVYGQDGLAWSGLDRQSLDLYYSCRKRG